MNRSLGIGARRGRRGMGGAARALLALGTGALAGCMNDGAGPTGAVAGGGVRLAVSAQVEGGTGAERVEVAVSYHRAAEAPDDLREILRDGVTRESGPTSLDFALDLADCLKDDVRTMVAGRGCDLQVDLALTDGEVTLDRAQLEFPGVIPGTTVRSSQPIVLVAARSVQIEQGAAVELQREEVVALRALVRDARGAQLSNRSTLRWSVLAGDRQDVVSVDAGTGSTRGMALGTTRVTAVDGRAADTVTITVAAPPAIAVDQAAVAFGAARLGELPAARTVVVSNTGGRVLTGLTATVEYTSAPQGAASLQWLPPLAVQPTQVSAAAPAALVIRPTRTDLPVGEYRARVRVAASGLPASATGADTIQVRYVVSTSPVITPTPASLAFSVVQGNVPPAATVAITNGGTGTLQGISVAGVAFTQGTAGWLPSSSLTLAEPAPAGSGAVALLTVRPASASLAPGSFRAVVTLRSSVAGVADVEVPVTLTVAPTPTFAVLVSGAGTGAGTVTVQAAGAPAGTCGIAGGQASGAGCSTAHVSGTVVDLLPQASTGSAFLGWAGACTGTGACRLTVGTQAISVAARFAATTSDPETPTADKTWAGGTAGAPTKWSVPTNWSPVGAPVATDRVRIPRDAWAQPLLDDAGGAGSEAHVRSIDVETQATLTIATSLRVSGDVRADGAIAGGGTLFVDGAEAELRGNVATAVLDGEASVVLSGDTRATSDLTIRDGSRLFVGGRALVVGGALRLASAGSLASNDPADSVDVGGALDVAATSGVEGTAGVLRVAGAVDVSGQGRLRSGPAHRFVLDGGTPQAVRIVGTTQASVIERLVVANPTTIDVSGGEATLSVGKLELRNPSGATRLLGGSGTLQARNVDVQGAVFDRLRLVVIADPAQPKPALARVEFTGRPSVQLVPSWVYLAIDLRGGGALGSAFELSFTELRFESISPNTPSSTTAYLRAIDANDGTTAGPSLVVNVTSPNVADGRPHVITGGEATVIWNGLGPE